MESLKPSQELHKLLLLQSGGGKETDPCASSKCVRSGRVCMSFGGYFVRKLIKFASFMM